MVDTQFTGKVVTGGGLVSQLKRPAGLPTVYYASPKAINLGYKPGDIVQYGDNYYLTDASKNLTLETDSKGNILSNQLGYVTSHHPVDYVSPAYTGPKTPVESPTGFNITPRGGYTGILVSAKDSLTGGGLTNDTGVNTMKTTPSGVYAATGGQLEGSQIIVSGGTAPTTAGELIGAVKGGTFQPIGENSPLLADKIIGVVQGDTINLGTQKIAITDQLTGKTTETSSIPTNWLDSTPTKAVVPVENSFIGPTNLDIQTIINPPPATKQTENPFISTVSIAPDSIIGSSTVQSEKFMQGIDKGFYNPGNIPFAAVTGASIFFTGEVEGITAPILHPVEFLTGLAKPLTQSPITTLQEFGAQVASNPIGIAGQLWGLGKIMPEIKIPYSKTVPSEIQIGARSASAARTILTEDTVAATGNFLGIAKVEGKIFPTQTNAIIRAERISGTDQFGVIAEFETAINTGKKTQFFGNNLIGGYSSKTNVAGLRSPKGDTIFITQGGRSEPVFFDTVSMMEQSPSRFINLATGEKSTVPVVKSVGRTSGLTETIIYNKLPYKNVEGINLIGEPIEKTVVNSNVEYLRFKSGGAETDLFRGGFQNLKRVGLWKEPFVEPPIRTLSFLESRKGAILLEEPKVIPKELSVNPLKTNEFLSPKNIELGGLSIKADIAIPKEFSFTQKVVPLRIATSYPTVKEAFIQSLAQRKATVQTYSFGLSNRQFSGGFITPTRVSSTPQKTTLSGSVFSSTKSSQSPIGKSSSIPAIIPITKTVPLSNTEFVSRQEPISRITPISMLTPSVKTTQISSSELLSRQEPISRQETISRQDSLTRQEQITRLEQIQKTNILMRSETAFGLTPPTPNFLLKEERKKRRQPQGLLGTSNAYRVLVKRRGKYRPLVGGLTRTEAVAAGAKFTRSDLAASFKVQRTNEFLQDRPSREHIPADFSKTFRDYRIVKGKAVGLQDEWIQRRTTRLSSVQEKNQIQASRRRTSWL